MLPHIRRHHAVCGFAFRQLLQQQRRMSGLAGMVIARGVLRAALRRTDAMRRSSAVAVMPATANLNIALQRDVCLTLVCLNRRVDIHTSGFAGVRRKRIQLTGRGHQSDAPLRSVNHTLTARKLAALVPCIPSMPGIVRIISFNSPQPFSVQVTGICVTAINLPATPEPPAPYQHHRRRTAWVFACSSIWRACSAYQPAGRSLR